MNASRKQWLERAASSGSYDETDEDDRDSPDSEVADGAAGADEERRIDDEAPAETDEDLVIEGEDLPFEYSRYGEPDKPPRWRLIRGALLGASLLVAGSFATFPIAWFFLWSPYADDPPEAAAANGNASDEATLLRPQPDAPQASSGAPDRQVAVAPAQPNNPAPPRPAAGPGDSQIRSVPAGTFDELFAKDGNGPVGTRSAAAMLRPALATGKAESPIAAPVPQTEIALAAAMPMASVAGPDADLPRARGIAEAGPDAAIAASGAATPALDASGLIAAASAPLPMARRSETSARAEALPELALATPGSQRYLPIVSFGAALPSVGIDAAEPAVTPRPEFAGALERAGFVAGVGGALPPARPLAAAPPVLVPAMAAAEAPGSPQAEPAEAPEIVRANAHVAEIAGPPVSSSATVAPPPALVSIDGAVAELPRARAVEPAPVAAPDAGNEPAEAALGLAASPVATGLDLPKAGDVRLADLASAAPTFGRAAEAFTSQPAYVASLASVAVAGRGSASRAGPIASAPPRAAVVASSLAEVAESDLRSPVILDSPVLQAAAAPQAAALFEAAPEQAGPADPDLPAAAEVAVSTAGSPSPASVRPRQMEAASVERPVAAGIAASPPAIEPLRAFAASASVSTSATADSVVPPLVATLSGNSLGAAVALPAVPAAPAELAALGPAAAIGPEPPPPPPSADGAPSVAALPSGEAAEIPADMPDPGPVPRREARLPKPRPTDFVAAPPVERREPTVERSAVESDPEPPSRRRAGVTGKKQQARAPARPAAPRTERRARTEAVAPRTPAAPRQPPPLDAAPALPPSLLPTRPPRSDAN